VEASLTTELRRLFAAEADTTATARRRAAPLYPPDPEFGALLRWAVRSVAARAVVEVGAAGGVSGAWIVPELPERGVLTSIEPDPHAHGLATDAFQAMAAGARVRAILGEADTVLGRLSDGAYDLLLLQGSPRSRRRCSPTRTGCCDPAASCWPVACSVPASTPRRSRRRSRTWLRIRTPPRWCCRWMAGSCWPRSDRRAPPSRGRSQKKRTFAANSTAGARITAR
jgi:hypothetical protein